MGDHYPVVKVAAVHAADERAALPAAPAFPAIEDHAPDTLGRLRTTLSEQAQALPENVQTDPSKR